MMEFSLQIFLLAILAIGFVVVGFLVLLSFFVKIEQGKALIVNTMRAEPIVTFTGRIVLPVIHKSEKMDISLKTIEIDRRGREGLICRDNIRADIKVTFFVRVNKTVEDVLKVAQAIGCARASDQDTLEELFIAKFSEALKTVGKQLDFEDLYKERDSFRDSIIELIGKDLNGYALEDAAIDYLEQTPMSELDPNNILDAQGIRKITELTAAQNVLTNEFKNRENMTITKQNVEANEAILELQRRQADAEARQAREIQNVRDREQAETVLVAQQEKQRTESIRIETDEKTAVREANKMREIEVAEQNRLRVVSIEKERVKLAQEQEVIAREKEITLQRIAKEKAVELEKRDIATVIRERVIVEKTVAEEEEKTKELRVVAEAERQKKVLIIASEAKAQEVLVTDIKEAEAAHEAAKFQAMQKITIADAEREVSERTAAAKIRLAEGVQAEKAAAGLAEVRVKEANALAIEKEGASVARALLEKMQAEAKGEEQKGLASARVREVAASASEKEGSAVAKALRERLEAEAQGEEQKGMALVRVKEAEANIIEKQGIAKAVAVEKQLLAEAAGLAEKFKSLDALSEAGRLHEEFRLQLEQRFKLEQAALETQKVVAEQQARILAEAFKHARIDIVGGESLFFERILNSTSLARATDAFVGKSQVAQTVLQDYLTGSANVVTDLKEIVGKLGLGSEDVQNLTVSAFLAQLMANGSVEQQSRLKELVQALQIPSSKRAS